MSDSTTESMVEYLTGRLDIFSSAESITPDNVISEANDAIAYHLRNVIAEEYLYWYRRGYQPVLSRTKERNDFVLNKVVENHAEEFCVFKNGYFLMEPAFYVSRNTKSKGKVDKLNEYLYRSGKQAADNKVADWFHMTGKGVLFVEPADDDDIPLHAYALDPRSAFVVYSMRPGNKPLFACNVVSSGNDVYIDLFTADTVYRLYGRSEDQKTTAYPDYATMALELRGTEPNVLGHIPIIEYKYNTVGMSCFEAAISLLDAINETQSNRIDGVSQFIQSLAIAVNCEFEDGVTANTIREAGMIALRCVRRWMTCRGGHCT